MKRLKKILPFFLLLTVLIILPGFKTLAASAPAQVKSVKIQVVNMSANSTITLSWKKVAKAKGYRVYSIDGTTRTRVATSKKTTCTVKNLTPGTKYYFQVVAYNAAGEGTPSGTVAAKTTNWMKDVHQRYFVATVTSTTKATVVSSGKSVSVAKNTRLVAHTRTTSKKKIKATLADGTVVMISNTKLRYGNVKTTTEYYPTNVKENFVNAQGYSSLNDYLVWVNQYTCTTTIFKGSKGNWKEVATGVCVIGNGGKTKPGVYKILKQDVYHNKPRVYFSWNEEKQWGQAFHCRKDSNKRSAVSDGCVRLGDSLLFYLVAHCPVDTTVVVY
jgi:hypothetical protein